MTKVQNKKFKKKQQKIQLNRVNSKDWDNFIGKKKNHLKGKREKKKHIDQFSIHQILNDEIEIHNCFLKKSSRVNLWDSVNEPETNLKERKL
jgi:hypothetical protein